MNCLGGVHGGVIFLLADTAFGVACNSHGRPAVARSCQIEFFAGAAIGDRLEARASERMRGGRNGIYDVAVTRAPDGLLIAEMRGNGRELPPITRPRSAFDCAAMAIPRTRSRFRWHGLGIHRARGAGYAAHRKPIDLMIPLVVLELGFGMTKRL